MPDTIDAMRPTCDVWTVARLEIETQIIAAATRMAPATVRMMRSPRTPAQPLYASSQPEMVVSYCAVRAKTFFASLKRSSSVVAPSFAFMHSTTSE